MVAILLDHASLVSTLAKWSLQPDSKDSVYLNPFESKRYMVCRYQQLMSALKYVYTCRYLSVHGYLHVV